MSERAIRSALISVYHKQNLEPILHRLHALGVQLYSTGGTQAFIAGLGLPVTAVEDLTGYPSILGGRVKTLHPKVFGGILHRRHDAQDAAQVSEYALPALDLVIVDLYPFEATVASGAKEAEIIEKIDIGGISLIRAAAKNFRDVWIVPAQAHYAELLELLNRDEGRTQLAERQRFATYAFAVSSHYDAAIFNYFNQGKAVTAFRHSQTGGRALRYGENPHQRGTFYGPLEELLTQLHGKELSYNNLVDVEAAVMLMAEFADSADHQATYAILKHTNACGLASAPTPQEAYLKALAADPVSAFGGVIITNQPVNEAVAHELHQLFFEVLIAPAYDAAALTILQGKKNRILLRQQPGDLSAPQFRTLLNGVIEQDKDLAMETAADFRTVTQRSPTEEETSGLAFALKAVKHTKSNTIVLARAGQLLASGVGQTSRVDALRQAIEKARSFGFDLAGSVMASDAFFPFPDCVEIAHAAGVTAVVQPGGSVRDQDSVNFCDAHQMAMVMTGVRHFKH